MDGLWTWGLRIGFCYLHAGFVGHGRAVSQGRVQPDRVVPALDVAEDVAARSKATQRPPTFRRYPGGLQRANGSDFPRGIVHAFVRATVEPDNIVDGALPMAKANRASMSTHDIIVIGGSAGSIPVLRQICADLASDLPASVFVVVHVGARGQNLLGKILDDSGPLGAATAQNGEAIERGRIYVAPADFHLMVSERVVRLGRGPRENMTRPAIDPLLRSAAVAHGPRAIGVVLSGRLNDGSAGLAPIEQCGGLAVGQDPSNAKFPDTPASALLCCKVDLMAKAARLGALLSALAKEAAGPVQPVPATLTLETSFALGKASDSPRLHGSPAPAPFHARPAAACCPRYTTRTR